MKRTAWPWVIVVGFAVAAWAGEQAPPPIRECVRETVQTETQRELLIGSWKGEAPVVGGGSRSWVTHRAVDGTYRIDFTLTDPLGITTTNSEAGIWGASAGIYFTAVRALIDGDDVEEADTTDPSLYNVYKIIRLNQEIFEYENPASGNRFIMKRLPKASR